MAPKARGKRAKLPFWKRYGAEIEHITDHIGRAFDNAKPKDWADAAILAALAYLSYDKIKTKETIPDPAWKGIGPAPPLVIEKRSLQNLLFGPVCYKLATTQGGTPPLSQITGLAGLAFLGIVTGTDGTLDLRRGEEIYGKVKIGDEYFEWAQG